MLLMQDPSLWYHCETEVKLYPRTNASDRGELESISVYHHSPSSHLTLKEVERLVRTVTDLRIKRRPYEYSSFGNVVPGCVNISNNWEMNFGE